MSEQLYEVRCPICGRSVPPQGNLLAYKCEHSTPAVPPPAEQGDANLCVFCGSESIEAIPDHDEDGPMFYVYCGRCEAQGPVIYSVPSAGHKATPEEAIKAWNTRTPQPAGEGIEELARLAASKQPRGTTWLSAGEPSSPASDARAEAHKALDAYIDARIVPPDTDDAMALCEIRRDALEDAIDAAASEKED
jgi:hypothetical protein